MTKILFELVLAITILTSVEKLQAQDEVSNILFQKEKTCTYSIQKGTFFKNQDSYFKTKFAQQQMSSGTVVGKCKDRRVRIENSDTLLFLGTTITTLKYKNSYASCVFDTILSISRRVGYTNQTVWSFNKPGRIYALRKSDQTVTIISVNSCAERPRFNKLVAAIRKQKIYDKILVIPCGADSREVMMY